MMCAKYSLLQMLHNMLVNHHHLIALFCKLSRCLIEY